jgi:hypothetical protein
LEIVCEFQKQSRKSEKHMKKFIEHVQQQFTQTFSDNVTDDADDIDLTIHNETESVYVSEKPDSVGTLEPDLENGRNVLRERTFSALISIDCDSEVYEEAEQLHDNIEETENDRIVDNTIIQEDTEENLGEIGVDYSVDELIDEEQLQPAEVEPPLKEDTEEVESEIPMDYLDNSSYVENNEAESELNYESVADELKVVETLIICGQGAKFDVTPKTETIQSFSDSSTPTISSKNLGIDISRNMCLQCNKSYSSKTSMHDFHLCLNGFVSLIFSILDLMRHLITHDGKTKPFQCNQCGSAFTQNGEFVKTFCMEFVRNVGNKVYQNIIKKQIDKKLVIRGFFWFFFGII